MCVQQVSEPKIPEGKTPFSEQLQMTFLYFKNYLNYNGCNFILTVIVQGPEIC